MLSRQEFVKAPKVSAIHVAQSCSIEADMGRLTADEAETFHHAANVFRFLVPNNKTVSGAKWVALISKAYDIVGNPRNAEMVRVLSKGMLVDKFPEETEVDYFESHKIANLPAAVRGILAKSPVGLQDYTTQERNDELVLSKTIEYILSKGYSSLVASGVKDASDLRQAGSPNDDFVRDFPKTLKSFVGDMLQRGWDPESEKCKVFLTRPAPVFSPPAARAAFFNGMQPYESMLTENLIAWRIPQFHLQEIARQVQEEKSEEKGLTLTLVERG